MKLFIYMWKLILIIPCVLILQACRSTNNYDKNDVMYAMIYDYDNNEIQNVNIYVDGIHVGDSDVHGRFIFTQRNNHFLVQLRKASYETLTAEINFDTLKVAYFKLANAEQLRNLSEESLEVRDYEQALDYCNR